MKHRIFRHPLFYLLLVTAAVKVFFLLSRYHLFIWDEAVYLGMGKWIFSAGRLGIWEWIRPLGLPLVLGALWKTGLNYQVLADLVILLFTLGTIAMTYLIAEEVFNRKTAFLSAIFLLATPVFFYNSMLVMTGIPSLFFILLAVYLAMKKKYWLSGLFSFLAFFFRYPAGLIIVAVNLMLLYKLIKRKNWKHILRPALGYNLVFFSGLAAYLLYNRLSFGQFLEPFLLASQHQSSIIGNIPGFFANLLYYPYTIVITNIFIISVLFFRYRKNSGHVLVPLAVFLLYFTAIPHKQPRFAILFLPYVMMLASSGFFTVVSYLKKYRSARMVLLLLLLGFIAYPAYLDYQIFSRLPSEEPGIVKDYYSYFDGYNGTILTSDPVPAAYTDSRYIGYYSNMTNAWMIYDTNINNSIAVIYTPASFPCIDQECNASKTELENEIKNDATLVYNSTWLGELKQIYVK